jgi:hypothetical protein
MEIRYGFFVVLLLAMAAILVRASTVSDNTNLGVPSDNGTSGNQTITGRMEQYAAYYGNVSMQVRNNTAAGNVLYSKTVTSGKLYFLKNGATFPTNLIAAPANSTADTAIGLSGFYVTANHFDTTDTVCGVGSAPKITTTDSVDTGMFSEEDNTNYLFCTDITTITSTNGFGTINYEVIVPTTSLYTAYDVWFDLT